MQRPGIRGHLPVWVRLAVAAVTVAVLLTAVGGAAAATKVRVGDRISLLSPLATYPAGTAFHIWHGFVFQDGDVHLGRYRFELDVDGVERSADFFDVTTFDRGTISKVWTFNFPSGLTGTHTFDGYWITPDGTDSLSATIVFTP